MVMRTGKRAARLHRNQDRLLRQVPVAERLLVLLAQRQRRLATAVDELVRLLDDHGATALEAAINEALLAGSAHPASVRLILAREQRRNRTTVTLGVDLPEDPRVRDLAVTPHRLDDYDPEHQP